MMELQDKALLKLEKKSRDRGIKRNKRTSKKIEILEVDGASPTNSDIARKQILTRSVRRAMALGKCIGIQFIDDEEEILEDFVRAKMEDN
ncbi:hypothetical protein V6N12_065303 [Hibiscus sabdariffa]|uniref:Uncharacterized protein n=1 Tax=Hibiscus sabdariffa TaxID=183260 RepID=A0ABR2G9C0_9ROSI